MATARSGVWQDLVRAWLQRASRAIRSPARGVWTTVLTVGLAIFVVWWAWGKWGNQVLSRSDLKLAPEHLVLPPAPKWVGPDLLQQVIQQGSLENASLLDPELTVKVRHALEMHPWIESVQYVSKHASGKVVAELRYRQPAAMVVTEAGWWPVDTFGVLLPPSDFSEQDPSAFLQIWTPFNQPAGDVGTSFGHPGVVGAARLAALMLDRWQSWGLTGIYVHHLDEAREAGIEFELLTKRGTRIEWGSPPGNELPGESLAAEKLHRLEQVVESRGSLDLSPPAWIDVRHSLTIRPLDLSRQAP